MLHRFDVTAPRDRAAPPRVLAERGRAATVLAGGTDVLVNIRSGAARPELVVDIKRVPGFDVIDWSPEEGLSIRPATTINALLHDEVVREKYPLLVACASDLASHQIRNRATVIGNIVVLDGAVGQSYTHALVNGAGSDDNALFQIFANEATLRLPWER